MRGGGGGGGKADIATEIQRHCSVKQAKLVQSQQFSNVPHEKNESVTERKFSTFFILENVGKIKNVKNVKKRDKNKKRKKRFLHLWSSACSDVIFPSEGRLKSESYTAVDP